MRKLLLTVLLIALYSRPALDPGELRLQPRRLPSFPLAADSSALSPTAAGSVLLIPLDGKAEAFRMTSAEAGVAFDIDGDGDREQVAWPEQGAEVALLALDHDGDGRITSGRELFGSYTMAGARNGFNALTSIFKATGAPVSGSIREGHLLYRQLLLWVDRNHNGVSEPQELRHAKDVFTAIGLGYSGVGWRDVHGNRVRYEAWAEFRTGGLEQAAAIDPAEHQSRLGHHYEVVLTTRSP